MRRLAVFLVVATIILPACGGDDTDDQLSASGLSTTTAAPTTTSIQPVDPAPNAQFSGSLEVTPNVSGTISFIISGSGQIEEMTLDAVLNDFDCGGGMTISSSGAGTYFFPDPITIQAGRFSISRSDLDWNGEFNSATSIHGSIQIDAGSNCTNRPSVTWAASAGE